MKKEITYKEITHSDIFRVFKNYNVAYNLIGAYTHYKSSTNDVYYVSFLYLFLAESGTKVKFGANLILRGKIKEYRTHYHIVNIPCNPFMIDIL